METEVTVDIHKVEIHSKTDHETISNSMLKAGTGYMVCLSEIIRELQNEGYTDNLVPAYDHLCCRSGEVRLYPDDLKIEKMVRFENSSDPDDQAILYAITCEAQKIKGLYVDSYGFYHDDLSPEMLKKFKECPVC
jgi:hypothetical protein